MLSAVASPLRLTGAVCVRAQEASRRGVGAYVRRQTLRRGFALVHVSRPELATCASVRDLSGRSLARGGIAPCGSRSIVGRGDAAGHHAGHTSAHRSGTSPVLPHMLSPPALPDSMEAMARWAWLRASRRRTFAAAAAAPADSDDAAAKQEQPQPAPKPKGVIATHAPGVIAAAAVMQAGFFVADYLGQGLLSAQGITTAASSPISGIPVSILLGMALNNAFTLPESLRPGLKACTTTALRAGIVCVGLKLSAVDVMTLGAAGVPAVVASIGAGLGFITWFSRRMGLPTRMGYLIAAGSSICGVTAITALAPAINANQKEVAFAVANVVAFGTLGMLTYPYLAHAFLPYSEQIGMFLGLAVHDTSQVIGAALTYKEVFGDELVLKVAAVTKLTRNLFLAGVIPGLAWMSARDAVAAVGGASGGGDSSEGAQNGGGSGSGSGSEKRGFSFDDFKKYVPMFVVGFIAMAGVRTLGDTTLAGSADDDGAGGKAFGMWDQKQWKDLTALVGNNIGGHYLLGTAMAAVGLNTSAAVLRGVGPRPFIVGLAGSLVVGATGLSACVLLSQFMDWTPTKDVNGAAAAP